MNAFKIHVGVFCNPGWDNADFRGERAVGKEQRDYHATVRGTEIDPLPDELVEHVLAICTEFNKKTVKEIAPGVWAGTRYGVWDGDGRV